MFELPGGVKREEWFEETERSALVVWKEKEKWLYRVMPQREVKKEMVTIATVVRYHHATYKDIVGEWYDYFDREYLVVWRWGFADTPRERRQTAICFNDGTWWAVSPFEPPNDPYGPEEFRFLIVKPPPSMVIRVEVTRVNDGERVYSQEIGQ